METIKRKYTWHPSRPSLNAIPFTAVLRESSLPGSVDLRTDMPPIYDQGQLGSCVDNAVAGACHYVDIKQKDSVIEMPSRLFLYYGARSLEGTINSDSGSSVADGCSSAKKWGYPDESLYPYNISNFRQKPSDSVYKVALPQAITQYSQVSQDESAIKSALFQQFPVLFGFTCYPSLESKQTSATGDVPYPSTPDIHSGPIGGHCVLIVGYDDVRQVFIIRNSWGTQWGKSGYGTMPYKYVLSSDLSSDFWIITKVPGEDIPTPPSPPNPIIADVQKQIDDAFAALKNLYVNRPRVLNALVTVQPYVDSWLKKYPPTGVSPKKTVKAVFHYLEMQTHDHQLLLKMLLVEQLLDKYLRT